MPFVRLVNRYDWLFRCGLKQPGRESDHSPPCNINNKEVCSYTATPLFVFLAWSLIKHRHNFTYTSSERIRRSRAYLLLRIEALSDPCVIKRIKRGTKAVFRHSVTLIGRGKQREGAEHNHSSGSGVALTINLYTLPANTNVSVQTLKLQSFEVCCTYRVCYGIYMRDIGTLLQLANKINVTGRR
jgi:hypothetical protein